MKFNCYFTWLPRMGLRLAGQLEIEMGVGEEDTFAQNSLLILVAAP